MEIEIGVRRGTFLLERGGMLVCGSGVGGLV